MSIALIISNHNQAETLGALLSSLRFQTKHPDFIGIADDRSNDVETMRSKKMLCDIGWYSESAYLKNDSDTWGRGSLCKELVTQSKCDKIIFMEADCVPAPELIALYDKYLEYGGRATAWNPSILKYQYYTIPRTNTVLFGSRFWLPENLTQPVIHWIHQCKTRQEFYQIYIPTYGSALWCSAVSDMSHARIQGCNFAITRKTYEDIGGHDDKPEKLDDAYLYHAITQKGYTAYPLNEACVFHFGFKNYAEWGPDNLSWLNKYK